MSAAYWSPELKDACAAMEERMKWAIAGIEPINQCNCIGPQDGRPLCPCLMRTVKVVDGRYVRTIDLGPAP